MNDFCDSCGVARLSEDYRKVEQVELSALRAVSLALSNLEQAKLALTSSQVGHPGLVRTLSGLTAEVQKALTAMRVAQLKLEVRLDESRTANKDLSMKAEG